MLLMTVGLVASTQVTSGLRALRAAEVYRAEGAYTAAAHAYRQAMTYMPQSPNPALRLVTLYQAWGQSEDGLLALNEARRRGADPDTILSLRMTLLAQSGAWAQLTQTAQARLQQKPDDVQALSYLTTSLLQQQHCHKAYEIASQWDRVAPTSEEAQLIVWALQSTLHPAEGKCTLSPALCVLSPLDLSFVLIQQGRWALAGCILAELQPTPEIHTWLGQALMHVGQLEEAGEHLKQATEQAPDAPLGWLLLGLYYIQQGEATAAQHALFQAHQLDPTNPAPCLAIAEALALESRYEETVPWMEAALLRAPDDVAVWNAVTRFYTSRNLRPDPFPMYAAEGALTLAPDNAEAQMLMGWAYLNAGKINNALLSLENAINNTPNLAEAHYLRSLALQRDGQTAEAQKALTRAVDLGYQTRKR